MKKTQLFFFIALVFLVTLPNADAVENGTKDIDIIGKKDYTNYCASCHGSDGKGDGPVAYFLKRKPIDLTQLSKDNESSFPFDRIWSVFDGSYQFDEHGSSEMPIWGYKFIRETQDDNEPNNAAKAKALNIILYIQVIQE